MADGQVFSTVSIEAAQNGEVQVVASLQCGVLIALDDLDENTVALTAHTPDFGFTSWEAVGGAGAYTGLLNGMENLGFGDHARSGQDVSVFDNFRIHVDMRRGAVDNVAQIGTIIFSGNGAEVVGGFDHIEVRWQRKLSTTVDASFFVRDQAGATLQNAVIGTDIAYAVGDDLRWIFVVKWPVVQCFTAPAGQNSPKTLLGSFSLESDYRPNARIGFEAGASGTSATIFGIGASGEFALYDLGPEQNNQIQITVSTEVSQNGEAFADASMEVLQNGETQAIATVEVSQNSEVQFAASMQCAVLIVLDDLDENGVNLSSHVPDFGFTSWETEGVGDYVGASNGMENRDVFKNARSGQDIAVVDNFRVHCDMHRGAVDSIGQVGFLLINGVGAEPVDGFNHAGLAWQQNDAATVNVIFDRIDENTQGLQLGVINPSVAFAAGDDLRWIFIVKWPFITCYTAPVGQNSPKILIGTGAFNAETRSGARVGILGGFSTAGEQTIFGVGASGEFALYQLGPEQNNIVQVAASIEVRQKPGEVQFAASMQAHVGGETQIAASVAIKQNSVVQITASIAAKQNGVVQAVASVEVEQHGDVQIVASLATKVSSAVQFAASMEADTTRFTEPFPPGRNDMLLTTRIRGRGRLRRR